MSASRELDARQRRVLWSRVTGETLSDIGVVEGRCAQRVGEIERKAIRRIRRTLDRHPSPPIVQRHRAVGQQKPEDFDAAAFLDHMRSLIRLREWQEREDLRREWRELEEMVAEEERRRKVAKEEAERWQPELKRRKEEAERERRLEAMWERAQAEGRWITEVCQNNQQTGDWYMALAELYGPVRATAWIEESTPRWKLPLHHHDDVPRGHLGWCQAGGMP